MTLRIIKKSDEFILGKCGCDEGEDIAIINNETGCLRRWHKPRLEPHICAACGNLEVKDIFEHTLNVHGFNMYTWKATTERGNRDRDFHLDAEESR